MRPRDHLRRTIKLSATASAYYTGIVGLYRRSLMRNRALVLMYHRVAPPDFGVPDYSPVGMTVTPDEFARQIDYVTSRYEVVPLAELVEALARRRMPRAGMCAVTFDDGWQDVYQFAFPIMKSHSIPATVFLTSGLIFGGEWFWEERLKFDLASVHRCMPSDKTEALSELAACNPDVDFASVLHATASALPAALTAAVNTLRALDDGARTLAVGSIGKVCQRISAGLARAFLDETEIVEMAAAGISFGHHTRSHSVLPRLTDDAIDEELSRARAEIVEITGTDPVDFAYPYGKFDSRVRDAVQRHGFRSACSTERGLCSPGDDPFVIKRINMASRTTALRPQFAATILGL